MSSEHGGIGLAGDTERERFGGGDLDRLRAALLGGRRYWDLASSMVDGVRIAAGAVGKGIPAIENVGDVGALMISELSGRVDVEVHLHVFEAIGIGPCSDMEPGAEVMYVWKEPV